MACSSSLEDSLAFSNEGVSLTFKTRFCLQLVLLRQAYVAKTSDQFCHVSTRHAFKIWEDIILSAKTCDVIKRGFPRLQGRPLAVYLLELCSTKKGHLQQFWSKSKFCGRIMT
jgi:hypothetical protein